MACGGLLSRIALLMEAIRKALIIIIIRMKMLFEIRNRLCDAHPIRKALRMM